MPEEVKATVIKGLLETHILPHLNARLMEHVKRECESYHITVVHKDLDEGFCSALPSLVNASSQREILLKRNATADAPQTPLV